MELEGRNAIESSYLHLVYQDKILKICVHFVVTPIFFFLLYRCMTPFLSYYKTVAENSRKAVKDVKVKTCEFPVLKACLRRTDFNLDNYISYS